MELDYTISNFRAIDKNGAYVDLRPITILTGCNNSGKSSIVKSLCLLNDFFRQIENDFRNDQCVKLHGYRLDFHKRPNDVLGGFSQVVHEDNGAESSSENGTFKVELSSYSHFFMKYVLIQLTFCSLEEDDLDNGYLQSFSIRDTEGNTIFSSNRDGEIEYDFELVKKELLYFIHTQHFLQNWLNEVRYSEALSSELDLHCKSSQNYHESIKALINAFGGRGVIELLEWHTMPLRYAASLTYNTGNTEDVLVNSNLINEDFIKGLDLSVFSYFPFMNDIKGKNKFDTISMIENIVNNTSDVTSLDKKLIVTFLNNFKYSEYGTIYDMVSSLEKTVFFKSERKKTFRLNDEIFPMPHSIWNVITNQCVCKESDIPERLSYNQVLLVLDKINQLIKGTSTSYINYDEVYDSYNYFLSYNIDDILRKAIEDVLLQSLPGSLTYTRTSIVNVKRLYGLEEDNDFSDMLKSFFENKRKLVEIQKKSFYRKKQFEACSFLNKWVSLFGIAHHVEIKLHADGYGVTIRLYSNESDLKGMLLCDKGYGCTQLFSILLKIESAILESNRQTLGYHYYTHGIGEGLTKLMRPYAQLRPVTVALEEPENHLHPSYQSLLADMILDAYNTYGIQFIVESHSEYFIRKIQLLVAQKKVKTDTISLLYVNPTSRPSFLPMISDIGIDEEGCLKTEFGTGFFDESVRLSKELFKSKTDADEK